ncbi:amphi-Trp domain-containing protein [Micromonospora sp. LH3U1]|uniref:amphi-Trp domain-containing protein n=1 Tax=Micromonospora sp. LH3U1 TaxID=3018339 RepID=UPI00234A73DC|nr:amphi-Trp domain-containing protein [Micromonospora sp. LH3U1]WCN82649.1 amphi-Trp domain-containing protein [Micromonospora sp. LH3U1]
MDIYEDARTVPRADLAAWLRQLANQLESDGRIFYGAAGAVTVADTVRCELEIERENETELSVEIEFSWTVPAPVQAADEVEKPTGEDEQVEATPEA